MKEQIVKAKPISSLMGILVVLLIVGGLYAASILSNALADMVGSNLVSGLVFVLALLVAIYLMREQILEYHYVVDRDNFYLERAYGQRSKIIESFPLLSITEIGEEKAMREKHAEIKNVHKMTLRACPIEHKAIVYNKDGRKQMVVLQPDEELLTLLWDDEARARNRDIKWGS